MNFKATGVKVSSFPTILSDVPKFVTLIAPSGFNILSKLKRPEPAVQFVSPWNSLQNVWVHHHYPVLKSTSSIPAKEYFHSTIQKTVIFLISVMMFSSSTSLWSVVFGTSQSRVWGFLRLGLMC
ncbi:hypothetical protein AVEN_226361-1 [Araneus ventricosus]|uniref:Uncharacterized protein n=1 Tax=Araneus ventricosus TaxID=182803 RepID=A0A4Y2KWQ6_ARAVE|nr:hypothetical protein AVEN_226361-1 [Araneus ventricosus]